MVSFDLKQEVNKAQLVGHKLHTRMSLSQVCDVLRWKIWLEKMNMTFNLGGQSKPSRRKLPKESLRLAQIF